MVRAIVDKLLCHLRGHEWMVILRRPVRSDDESLGSNTNRYKRCIRCGERSPTSLNG